MEREFVDFELPVSKAQVKLKAWLTGREKRDIQSVFLNDPSFNVAAEEGKPSAFKGELVTKSQDKAFETIVVSIDGKTDDLVNTILDLREEDFNALVTRINDITRPKAEEESKKK